MKILFISNLFPPNVVGGYEVLCCAVAAALASKGHDVCVLTSSYGGEPVLRSDMKVRRALRLQIGANIYAPFEGASEWKEEIERCNHNALNQAIGEFRPDVVFCWNLYGLANLFFDEIQRVSQPVVVMLTDNWLLGMQSPQFWSEYFEKCVLQNGAPPSPIRSRKIGVNAIFGSNYMQALYEQAGMEFKSSKVVHNGVKDLSAAADLQQRNFKTAQTVKLLFAGRLVKIKGIETAIEAIRRANAIATGGTRLTLTIVGTAQDDSYMKHLRDLVKETGREDLFEFRDAVEESELDALFKEHDAYIFSSLYEPFSLTLIHAMLSGIPVVASDAGGNPEIVDDGVTGVLFRRGDPSALSDAVLKIVADEDLRRNVAFNGRQRALNFSFESMMDGMEAYLDEVARRG